MGVEEKEPCYTVGGNVNWYSHYGEQYGGFSKQQQQQQQPKNRATL